MSKQIHRGKINWNLVASNVSSRSITKCYQRYIHLTRKNNKTEFKPEDDQLLIEQHQLKNGKLKENTFIMMQNFDSLERLDTKNLVGSYELCQIEILYY